MVTIIWLSWVSNGNGLPPSRVIGVDVGLSEGDHRLVGVEDLDQVVKNDDLGAIDYRVGRVDRRMVVAPIVPYPVTGLYSYQVRRGIC